MATHTLDKELIKRIFNQLSGKVNEEEELVPEMAIVGSGYLWCYEITLKQIVRVPRGIKCFALSWHRDALDRIMVYTIANDVILIEESELIYTGFD